MELSADRHTTQLDSLRREVERLEQMLMLDANWRALKQLDARETAGDPLTSQSGAQVRASLVQSLAGNRLFSARLKLIETVALLSGDADGVPPVAPPLTLSDRMVLIGETSGHAVGLGGETFRTRIRAKAKAVEADPPPQPNDVAGSATPVCPPAVAAVGVAPAVVRHPDPLELIDGLSRRAVEVLRDHGVSRFEDIAAWTADDALAWRQRLEGLGSGGTGAWIEQAALLSTGKRTYYARRARSGDFAALVAMPEPLPQRLSCVARLPVAFEVEVASAIVTADAVPTDCVDVSHGATASEDSDWDTRGAQTSSSASGHRARMLTVDDLIDELRISAPRSRLAELSVSKRVDRAISHTAWSEPVGGDGTAGSADAGVALAEASPTRRGFTRPAGSSEPQNDSEVVVISRAAPQPLVNELASATRPRPAKLLRRLKEVLRQDRFEADGYAAYRAVVEEASVTIVRPVDGRERAGLSGSGEDAKAPEYSKFLKALTGGT